MIDDCGMLLFKPEGEFFECCGKFRCPECQLKGVEEFGVGVRSFRRRESRGRRMGCSLPDSPVFRGAGSNDGQYFQFSFVVFGDGGLFVGGGAEYRTTAGRAEEDRRMIRGQCRPSIRRTQRLFRRGDSSNR